MITLIGCNWSLDFLNGRPLSIQITCSITTLNTDVPHGCMLHPLLTHKCAEKYTSIQSWTTPEIMTSHHAEKSWSRLQAGVWRKPKEMADDLRRTFCYHYPFSSAAIGIAKSLKVLVVHITKDLTLTPFPSYPQIHSIQKTIERILSSCISVSYDP